MNKIEILINRLNKIGISLEIISNFPWIYLIKVNNNIVIEKFHSESSFTIAFVPISGHINFTNIKEIFKIIRKYK